MIFGSADTDSDLSGNSQMIKEMDPLMYDKFSKTNAKRE